MNDDIQSFLLDKTQKLSDDMAEIKSILREGIAIQREQLSTLTSRVATYAERLDVVERSCHECPARRRVEAYGGVSRDVISLAAVFAAIAAIAAVIAKIALSR
jgi:hypothetical protein